MRLSRGVAARGWYGEMWDDIKPPDVPAHVEFAELAAGRRPMDFPRDNYMYYAQDVSENYGFFFDKPKPQWVRNPWGHKLEGTPWPADVKRDMLRCREEPAETFSGDDASLERWLDTMTYEDYLTKVRKFHPEVARYIDPFLAAAIGLGATPCRRTSRITCVRSSQGSKGCRRHRRLLDSRRGTSWRTHRAGPTRAGATGRCGCS